MSIFHCSAMPIPPFGDILHTVVTLSRITGNKGHYFPLSLQLPVLHSPIVILANFK